jgi:HK97 family phage prohead protease
MSQPQIVYRSAELNYEKGSDGKPGILEGKMVPHGAWTEIRSAIEGNFMERIAAGALKKTFAERANRMRVLFEHGFSRLLDKQPIAKLEELRDEDDGAYYRAKLLPGLPELLLSGLAEGEYGSSIGMRMPIQADIDHTPKRSDYNPEGIPESTVTEASLAEISVTAFPSYEGATATVRSITDDVILETHGQIIIAKLAREDPQRLLELVRTELQVEPPHSEPPAEEAPQEEREPEHSPKPTKDWLSEKESEEAWRLP